MMLATPYAEAWSRLLATASPGIGNPRRASVATRRGDEDDDLMARIAAGDAGAFRRLMDRHVDGAYRLASRVAGSHAEAEDAVQEAFLKVWTKARSWEPGAARFSTWLWRVVLNQSLDARRRPRQARLDAVAEPEDTRADPLRTIAERQDEERLNGAVSELPERQRAALALVYGAGASNAEAADALGISIGALEQLLVRARRALRQRLGEGE